MVDLLNSTDLSLAQLFNKCSLGELTCCPHTFSNDIQTDFSAFHMIVIGVVLPIVGIFGLLGNTFSAFVFSRRVMRSSLNIYLCALALSDMGVILTGFFVFSIEALRKFDPTVARAFAIATPYSFPIGLTAQTCSVYLTVAAAIDCLIEVVLPRYSYLCTVRRAFIAIAIVVTTAALFNGSHWFEASIFECLDVRSGALSMDVAASPLRQDKLYFTIYYTYMYTIFMAVGPLIFLILVNSIIIFKVLSTAKSNCESQESSSDTITLILVVCLFIVCNSMALIVNFVELSGEFDALLMYLIDASNLLVVCNSSANFIIYYSFGLTFRRTLRNYMRKLERLPRRTLRGLLTIGAPAVYVYELGCRRLSTNPNFMNHTTHTTSMRHVHSQCTTGTVSSFSMDKTLINPSQKNGAIIHMVKNRATDLNNFTKQTTVSETLSPQIRGGSLVNTEYVVGENGATKVDRMKFYRCSHHQTLPLVKFDPHSITEYKFSI